MPALASRPTLYRPIRPVTRWVALNVALLVAVSFSVAASAATGQSAGKPKVPVGIDPGGFAVAVVGDGIDYTRPEIAGRLARDGEGEIIGFDLVDGDRLPYSATPPDACPDDALLDLDAQSPTLRKPEPAPAAIRCAARAPAVTLASGRGLARRLRVAVFRVAPADARKTAEALAMIARSPARIAVLQYPVPPELLREASARLPDLLILAPRPADGAHGADVCGLRNVVALGCHPADKDWSSDGLALVAADRAQRLGTWNADAIKSWFAGPRDLKNPG